MPNITKVEKTKSTIEIVSEIRKDTTVEYLEIDGIRIGVFGYASEKDKAAGIATIQKIVDNSKANGVALCMEVAHVLMTAAAHTENNILTDEELECVKINEKEFQISYHNKAIYCNEATKEVANCRDLPDMPNEAIKALLIDRARLWLVSFKERCNF